MLLDNIRRIIKEDFEEDDREMVSKLSFPINHFMENVVNILNGNIEYDNLSRSLQEIELTIGSDGSIIGNTKFAAKVGAKGTVVVRVDNISNSGTYPSGQPFISFSSDGQGVYQIRNISGLRANTKYRITFELIY